MLEHCYAMPVCHPTRVTLMTGQYPRHLNNPTWGSFPRYAESRTFANVAKNAGYATAVAGEVAVVLAERRQGTAAKNGL